MKQGWWLVAGVLILVVVGLTTSTSAAAYPLEISSANAALASAFISVHNAELRGANVTSLVSQLNSVVGLIQTAASLNSTNPSQATKDLENATQIAQRITSESVAAGRAGAFENNIRVSESVVSVVAIVVASAVVYIFGGRVYRRLWFLIYKNYVVKPADE